MNIKVDRQEFLKTLRIVEKAVAENKIRPIISCVYLEAQEDGKIVLRGYKSRAHYNVFYGWRNI